MLVFAVSDESPENNKMDASGAVGPEDISDEAATNTRNALRLQPQVSF